jgi:hypothetical protein
MDQCQPGSYHPRTAFAASRDVDRDDLRNARALTIWRDTERGANSIVSRYLASRELTETQLLITAAACLAVNNKADRELLFEQNHESTSRAKCNT